MPRKVPKWRQNRSTADSHTLSAKIGIQRRAGIDPDFLVRLKSGTSSDEIFALLNSLKLDSKFFQSIHGSFFPRVIEGIFSKPLVTGPSTLVNEIIWATVAIRTIGKQITEFINYKEQFELSVLCDDYSKSAQNLELIEHCFGWSAWLIQNRLAISQSADGVEEKRRLVAAYERQIEENSFLRTLVSFMSKRIEGTAVPGYLQSELLNYFEGANNAAYRFLKTKLFDLADPNIDDLALILSVDAHFSAIDYYESLIASLQAIAVNEQLAERVAKVLSAPIRSLYHSTTDKRLVPVLIAFGNQDKSLYVVSSSKEAFIEAYSKGEYEDAVRLANVHLKNYPDDMGALVMRVRSELKLSPAPIKKNGIMGEIDHHLRNVISLATNTYASALSLYTLQERFFGHSWTNFLRAVVSLELTSDKFDYPSIPLRRLIVLESEATPFTALLEAGANKPSKIVQYFNDKYLYGSTLEVFALASHGSINNPTKISEERRHRYLGSYELSTGNYIAAIENFEWLIANSSDAESLRASAAAAVSYSRLGDYEKSVERLISGYLKWPHAPTALPLYEIISKLEMPENWPASISLPLAFEVYNSYCSNDRMTHLRYAFERFQIDFEIDSPLDLSNRAEEFGLENVIYYLNNVWRPEVMRQTMLYEGTRQIEEERIKVCQVLAELDSKNSMAYNAEIRERVKTLEIAKATNLVEQSKVYVDIPAIKKALRTKLGDAYARYKSAAPTVPAIENPVMERISEMLAKSANEIPVTQLVSMLHLLNPQTSNELDLQFAAMFAEVTNEFLRGDHGLNAYLSTRVRHGKLSNALRKPAADEFLVTERKEGSSSYVPNHYWVQTFADLSEDEHNELAFVLELFASSLDQIIAHVKDDLIQVKVTHELVSKDTNRLALFSYQTSNLERMYMQTSDARVKSLDEFIDLCVEALWDKTDANLIHVQHVLRTEIRQQIMSAFDDLGRALNLLPFSDRLGEVYNHIYRARTSTQTQLMTVTSWFKRSEVYDRQDYSIEFPVLIATNMIRNSISGAGDWEGVTFNISDVEGTMPGRSLDAMVDLFCVVFENAIEHSGESLANLKVLADLDFKDGCFSVTLQNQVSEAAYVDRDEEKLQRIRTDLTKEDNRNRAQKEGRSGFHKLWAIINAPQYRDPSLVFGFTDSQTFEVTVSFSMEVSDEENADS